MYSVSRFRCGYVDNLVKNMEAFKDLHAWIHVLTFFLFFCPFSSDSEREIGGGWCRLLRLSLGSEECEKYMPEKDMDPWNS